MVVGMSPDRRGTAELDLAAMLARSAADDLILCTIVPSPWPPSPAKVDAEYRAELERIATEALEVARAHIPADIPATTLVRPARSVPAGLLEMAEEHDARVLVVGSSSIGAFGRVALGSVSSWLTEGLEAVVGYGESWEEALEDIKWQDGDVLAVGSSASGPIARVFLGSRASKIVRSSPVPVVVAPRGAAAELAGRAARGETRA
jgi:nucleotide-binding universal stress UspA family protein